MPAGREEKRGEPFFFALPQINSHGVGRQGAAGSGGSLNLGGGAFGLAIPAFREGECTELLSFALASFNYPGPGGGGFGESLQSAAAVLVDTCERDRKGSALNRFLLRFRR